MINIVVFVNDYWDIWMYLSFISWFFVVKCFVWIVFVSMNVFYVYYFLYIKILKICIIIYKIFGYNSICFRMEVV